MSDPSIGPPSYPQPLSAALLIIRASALAKIGKSVLHLDPNEYYAADQASLTLDELVKWASDRSSKSDAESSADTNAGAGSSYLSSQKRRFTHATTSTLTPELERDRRRYALSLYPAILPARGTLISTLIASDVSKYVGFRLLDSVGVWEGALGTSSPENPGARTEAAETQARSQVRRVPGNKEDVFKDKSVGLVDKRKLMKFLMWVAGDFEDDELIKGMWGVVCGAWCEVYGVFP
jgi:RAB protein geranylgeranyltransferase component A